MEERLAEHEDEDTIQSRRNRYLADRLWPDDGMTAQDVSKKYYADAINKLADYEIAWEDREIEKRLADWDANEDQKEAAIVQNLSAPVESDLGVHSAEASAGQVEAKDETKMVKGNQEDSVKGAEVSNATAVQSDSDQNENKGRDQTDASSIDAIFNTAEADSLRKQAFETESSQSPIPVEHLEYEDGATVTRISADASVPDGVTMEIQENTTSEVDAGGPYTYRSSRITSDLDGLPNTDLPGDGFDVNHSSIVLEKIDRDGNVVESRSAGMGGTGASGKDRAFGSARITIDEEELGKLTRPQTDAEHVHEITEEGYQAALDEIDHLKTQAEDGDLTYSLSRNNCHIFFRHIQGIATEGAVPGIRNPGKYDPHVEDEGVGPFEPDPIGPQP